MGETWDKVKEPVTGFAGAGTGLVISDLAAEYTARATGQTGYSKAGVKTLVKLVIGLLFFGVSFRVGGMWTIFTKVAAYTGWGSTIIDWIAAWYPGGIEGIAGSFAVMTRRYSVGTEKVAAELARLEGRRQGFRQVRTPTTTGMGAGDVALSIHNPIASTRVADGQPSGTGPSLTPSHLGVGIEVETIPFTSKIF